MILSVLSAVAFSACADVSNESTSEALDRAGIDIGNLTQNGAQVQSLTTPPGYKQGDKLVAYEGPGWESDRVAYRLYLDGRNAIDIFGKRSPDLVLSKVGRGEDYHAMADWGMDILKVGNSLGSGGFGVYKNGEVVQIGDAESYSASILKDDTDTATLEVVHNNSKACGGDVKGLYTIEGGSRLTNVKVSGECAYNYAAGLIIHPDTVEIKSSDNSDWAYLGRYGEQSLVPDNLGFALFYKSADVETVGRDNDDSYIVFKDGTDPHYYLGAAWSQEVDGVKTEQEFREWLKNTQTRLNAL